MSPLRFLFSSLLKPRNHHHYNLHRTFSDTSSTTVKCVRDRGLDHAVEREKNLEPIINIKNFIKAEPSKSLPISIIAENRDSLEIPTRPIEFIRKYPSVFEEFQPGGIAIHPHIRLTAEVLDLDSEEQLMYQSDSYKQQVADRLLKLLMLCRTNKLPLDVINRLKWDLGLPQDYLQSIVPEFPDYFRVVGEKDSTFGSEDARVLELVCWSRDLATSILEKKATRMDVGCTKEMPIAFSMQFSRGFEMDEKWKKWVDVWQKLPYVSPYENAAHLTVKSDESDKWAVAVLHEFLHILVPKKTEKKNVLCFGDYLGLRSRFKRALLHHPGIFYLSSKIGTYTVVLRDGYKRGSLIENHPLMDLRSQYIHLMNTEKEGSKKISGSFQKKQTSSDSRSKGEEEEEDENEEQNAGELFNSSDDEVEDDEKSKDVKRTLIGEDAGKNRGRTRATKFDKEGHIKFAERRRLAGKPDSKTRGKFSSKISLRTEKHDGHIARTNYKEKSGNGRSRRRPMPGKTST